ncbi:MAG: Required for respiratory growth protein 9 mitochondrial [Geoglossum simile]|nr:MAG: Required for respiratory growth protein 9 mitochondrial [Geoglossum simile]
MPCLACADRILGIFLREITSSNGRYTASGVAYTPKWRWFSVQRRTSRQVGRDPPRLPAATSNLPKIDLYVPFGEALTASGGLSLLRKAVHSENREANCPKSSLLTHISKDDKRRFFHDDVDHIGLGLEAGTALHQDAVHDSKAFDTPKPEHNHPRSWLSSSPKGAPEKLRDGYAFLDLSPIAIDAIAAEADADKSMYTPLPESGGESRKEAYSRTLSRVDRKGGRVEGGVVAMTTSCTVGKVRPRAEPWQIQKDVLEAKFGIGGWNPRKRLSPDALDGIRALNAQFPDKYTTPVLAEQFKVSPEAIRRILKSKWRPSDEEVEGRRARWDKRGEKIWEKMVELGVKPPKKWREMGIGKRKAGVVRSGHRRERERGPRKSWNSDSSKGLSESRDDWSEETLAERIL